jgi:hypothetical protein
MKTLLKAILFALSLVAASVPVLTHATTTDVSSCTQGKGDGGGA